MGLSAFNRMRKELEKKKVAEIKKVVKVDKKKHGDK